MVEQVAFRLMEVLELLGDGRAHGIEELRRRAKLNEQQMNDIVDFLTEYGFARVNPKSKKIMMNRTYEQLMAG